jgi:hypothetical protein
MWQISLAHSDAESGRCDQRRAAGPGDGRKQQGWQIGSGPTEAICKTTTARLKRCGMRCDADNADPGAPGLAGLEQSDQWKLYRQTRLKPTG